MFKASAFLLYCLFGSIDIMFLFCFVFKIKDTVLERRDSCKVLPVFIRKYSYLAGITGFFLFLVVFKKHAVIAECVSMINTITAVVTYT